jgi:hypothetical protein
MPIFDLCELKANLVDSALVLDMQLKRVVFPELARPMIPQLSGMTYPYLEYIWLRQLDFRPVTPALSIEEDLS